MIKPLTEAERDTLAHATAQYHTALLETPDDHPAREFLRSRHIGASTVEVFRLGYVETPFVFDHAKFTGMLVIPNLLEGQYGQTRTVGLKFRLLDHSGKGDPRPKYTMPYRQQVRLFNLRALNSPTDTVVVTEGEFDAMVCTAVGFPTIGIPGVSNWGKSSRYREKLLEGFSRVVLCRDSDKAGQDLVDAMEAVDGLEVRSFLPYKDVNEFYVAEGGEATRARINGETEPDPSLSDSDEEEEEGASDGDE